MYITALLQLSAAVDGGDDLLLRLYADGIESFPCTAVRVDKGLMICSGKCGRFTVGVTAPRADLKLHYMILFHTSSDLS